MKFLFITATPLDPIHGSGTYVGISTLAQALEKLGHSIRILAPTFWCPNFVLRRWLFNRFQLPFQLADSYAERGKKPTTFPVSHALRGTHNSIPSPAYDAIVGFDCDGFYWAQTRNCSISYFVSLKGILADEARQERGIVRKLLELQAKWEKKNVQNADLVLVTSRYCQGVVERMYGIEPAKIRIVPELIDIEEWEELLNRESADSHAERGNQRAAPVVLSVCRMYPRKNLGLLLQAWVHVKEKYPHAQLRIVGTGQEYHRWRRLAGELGLGESVQFLGDLTREALACEYKNCDIFCLPSRQEGFGIVFLEAMVAGKPIVAARMAAVPEVVFHQEQGLLVDSDSESQLAEALLGLIKDPQQRSRLGSSGMKWVGQFDLVRVTEQFLSLLSPPVDKA